MTHGRNITEARYKNSVDALHHLMSSHSHIGNGVLIRPRDSRQSFCTITLNPNGIFFTKSGIEYYFVEISCKDDIQYKIQAFGDEALELYKEVQRYISSKEKESSQIADGSV
jgi:hypothetical protein